MNKVWNCGLAACLALFMSSAAFAQDYEFSVGGPASFTGGAGSEHSADYTVLLGHMGEAPAAQGWSFGLEVQGGVPTAITMEGTDAEAVFSGEFINNGIIDPANNDGKEGVVSAVVLTLTGNADAVLAANAVSSILIVSTTFTVPAGGGTGLLAVVDGLQGVGQPVDIVVTEAGASKEFTTVDTEVALTEEVTCCGSAFTVGFSSDRLLNSTPGEGMIDDGETCNAVGVLDVSGATTVYADVASNNPDAGVQGWSVSIEATGGVSITNATSENTAGANEPDGRGQSAFEQTQLAAADANDGRSGAVSAIVLCLTGCGATLDPVGTESILALTVEQVDPAAETASGDILFASGLIGGGQPVDNVLTVDGGSGDVCNFEVAKVTVNIAPAAGVGPFLPGDSNNDGGVDIADPVWTTNELFREGPASPCAIAGDSNGDRAVDLADVTYTIAYQFLSGPPPADGLECVVVEVDAAGDLSCDDSSCGDD